MASYKEELEEEKKALEESIEMLKQQMEILKKSDKGYKLVLNLVEKEINSSKDSDSN